MPVQLARTPRALAGLLPAGVQSLGYFGAFCFIDDWTLTNRVPGVIVQKITRTIDVRFRVEGQFGQALTIDQMTTAFDPDNTILFLNTLTYWELFDVAAAGDIKGDQFQSNWFAKTNAARQPVATTKGVYTITGEAAFYTTTASKAALGFPTSAVPIANGLPSTTTDPTAALAAFTKSNVVTRAVQASWDCSVLNRDPAGDAFGRTAIAVT